MAKNIHDLYDVRASNAPRLTTFHAARLLIIDELRLLFVI